MAVSLADILEKRYLFFFLMQKQSSAVRYHFQRRPAVSTKDHTKDFLFNLAKIFGNFRP